MITSNAYVKIKQKHVKIQQKRLNPVNKQAKKIVKK